MALLPSTAPSLGLERLDNVHGGDSLPLGVLGDGNPPHAPHCRQGQALALPALSCLDLAQDHLLLMMAQAVLVLHHPHPV